MKKLLSLSLALFLLIFSALPALAEEDSVEVTFDGYSFYIPSWLADMCTLKESNIESGHFRYLGMTSDIYFECYTSEYEADCTLEYSTLQARERFFFDDRDSLLPSAQLTHRKDVSIYLFSTDTQSSTAREYNVEAISCPSSPVFRVYLIPLSDNVADEDLTEAINMIVNTLTYSDFIPVDEPVQPNSSASSSINLDSLSTQELLALRVQIDQAIINRASLSD